MTFRRSTSTAVILLTAAWPSLAAEQAPQAKIDRATAPASPLAAQPLGGFSATRDRPLFSPTRQPPAPPPVAAAPPPPPPPPPPDVVLLGVVMDGDNAGAIVRAGPAAKTARVHIGDDIGGWKVGQIEARKLVLLLNGRTATFNMFSGNSTHRSPRAGSTPQSDAAQHSNLVTQSPTSTDVPPSRRRRLQQ
jgi:hypothetical protein